MATERSVLVRLGMNPTGFIAGAKAAGRAINDLRKDIDKTNDRTAWLAQGFLALAPTLAPLGSVGVGALAGLATQMTLTAVAGGTLTLAMNGIGDALKALNDYQIDPTAAHLKALHRTMAFIGPTGRDLVRVLDEMRDGFIGLSNLARDKMFPGVIDGLEELRELGPQVEQIIAKVSDTLGSLASRAGEGLAGPRFKEFFDFLEADAAPTIDQMGRTLGNLADGFAAMLVAFAPLSRDFSGGMLEMSRAFADWAHGLRENATFQEFVDYIRENTPRVLDLIGQIAGTFIQLAEAAAPVGELLVPALTTFLKIIEAVADTPLGPIFVAAAAGMSIYGRAVALSSITTGGLIGKVGTLAVGYSGLKRSIDLATASEGRHRASQTADIAMTGRHKAAVDAQALSYRKLGRAVGPGLVTSLGLFAVAQSDVADKAGLSNTANGALIGSIGGVQGALVGGAIGAVVDFTEAYFKMATATKEFKGDVDGLRETLDQQTGAITKNTEAFVLNELAQQGAIDAARLVGISSDILVDAYLGDELAIYRVNQALTGGLNPALKDSEGRSTLSAKATQEHWEALELLFSVLGSGEGALADARGGLILTGDEVDTTRRKFEKATEAVDEFGDAVSDLDAKLEKRAGYRSYQAAVDALARSIKKNGTTLDINTQKGRDNQDTLDALAGTISEVAEGLQGKERETFLDDAMGQFDRLAGKLGFNKKELKELKDRLGLLDLVHADPEVRVKGVGKAEGEIDHIGQIMDHLDKKVVNPRILVGIGFHALDTGNNFGEGPGFASGGFTGHGRKHEPAGIVHKGEFVVPQPYAQRDRAMLEKMYLPGYANGGYVQPSAAAAPMAPGFDYDRLARAMLNARQQYGDVYISGDPTVWRKQMEDDARASATGALR